jgi:hypothetical protein
MEVPKKIIDKVNSIIAEKNAQCAREEAAKQKELAEQEKMATEKKSRCKELGQAADIIIEWLRKFYGNPDALRIFSVKKDIMLFVDKFWMGRPEPNSQSTWAKIEIARNEMFYRECHKGHVLHEECLGFTRDIETGFYITQAIGECLRAELIGKLHPDFLLAFASAVKNGKIWKRIEQSLE